MQESHSEALSESGHVRSKARGWEETWVVWLWTVVWGTTPGESAMDNKVKVVVLGTGQMGSGMIKLLLHKHGVELVGVYGRRASRVGMDVGNSIGLLGCQF
jgi:hypothetical protein